MSKVDVKRDSEKRFKSKLSRKHWRDHRLRGCGNRLHDMEDELEKQLEFAESRCGSLKQQLDYIKVLYGCGKPSILENDDVSGIYDNEENGVGTGEIRRISYDDLVRWNKLVENYPERDGDKAFLPQTISYTNTRASTNSSSKPISSKSSFDKKETVLGNQKEPSQRASSVKLSKGKRKKSSNSLKHKVKNKGNQPRFCNAICQTNWPIWQDPVVEIYKNTSANVDSESAADICCKRQKLDNQKLVIHKTHSGKTKKSKDSNENLVNATKSKTFSSFKSLDKIHIVKEEGVQTESINESERGNKNKKNSLKDIVQWPNSEKLYYETETVKSYCQPTISSKKKRVERNLLASLNTLNLKNIPFIAATSTAPSHNIGINIQQVLSIMKKRQPSSNGALIPILSDHVINDISQLPVGSRMTVNGTNEIESNRGDVATETHVDTKKTSEEIKSNVSRGKISEKEVSYNVKTEEENPDENENPDWVSQVQKLKKVLVFLHEDFTSLSQKYKRLQKKLAKRNINKTDAKGELAEIEKDLEKKEEEITIVIGLYKEILHLREDLKKMNEKYELVICERAIMLDGIKHSNSTHTQMSALLRKIQQFQDQLKR